MAHSEPSRSLTHVVPEVAAAVGFGHVFPDFASTWELPPSRGCVIYLVDGLGWEQLAAHQAHAPFLMSQVGEVGSATVPSTTATSLASLGTALGPGAHGLVGYTSRIPGTQRLLQALAWDKRVDPVKWQPHETAFGRLARAGVKTTVVNAREYQQSGLSIAAYRGAQYCGADRPGERIAALVAAVSEGPAVAYGYVNDLDWTGHRYGVDSPQWRAQLRQIDDLLAQTHQALPSDVSMLVIADHGMIDCRGEAHVDIDQLPGLRDGVALLGGEARFRHLYCVPGATEEVVQCWRETWGDRAVVYSREEATAQGWFGPVAVQVAPRLGDVIVAAQGSLGLFSTKDFRMEANLIGLHGSTTSAELAIPMIYCPPTAN